MNKFLFYCSDFDENTATIADEDFRHCVKVLRYGIGADIQCTDGNGKLYNCTGVKFSTELYWIEIMVLL